MDANVNGLRLILDRCVNDKSIKGIIQNKINQMSLDLGTENLSIISDYQDQVKAYHSDVFEYAVRDKKIEVNNFHESLSGLKIPIVSTPRFSSWKDILISFWQLQNRPKRSTKVRFYSDLYVFYNFFLTILFIYFIPLKDKIDMIILILMIICILIFI